MAGWLILPNLHLEIGWRVYVGVCSVPLWVALAAFPWLPESPEWLIIKGRQREAREVLATIARVNRTAPLPDELVLVLDADSGGTGSACDLFSPRLRRTTALLWFIYGAFGFTYYGAIVFIHKVFAKGPLPTTCATCAPAFDYQNDLIAASSELVGTTLALLLIDRVGRVWTQSFFYVGAAAGFFLLAWEGAPFWLTVVGAFVARGMLIATCTVAWVMTPELYPVEVRATGHQWATAANRVMAFGTPYIASGLGISAVAICYGVFDLTAALCPPLLPRETRDILSYTEAERIWPQRGSNSERLTRTTSHTLSRTSSRSTPLPGSGKARDVEERLLPVGQELHGDVPHAGL